MAPPLNPAGSRREPGVRDDLRWCLVYAALLAALTSLPYLLGAARSDADWEFSGFVVAVDDGNSYIAKMLAGEQGEWLFRSPYSTMPQRGVLAFVPYLLLGKLSDGSHGQLVMLFHLLRVAAIPLLVLSVYGFVGLFLAATSWRRWATLLATAGGGLGWLLVALGASDWLESLPLDFYSPETFGFLSVFAFPHLILARAGMLWGLTHYLAGQRPLAAGAILLATGALHSPVLVPALAALTAHQLVLLVLRQSDSDWRRRYIAAVLPVAPLLIYLAVSLSTDAYLQAWAAQNRIRSPHPLHYLVAYGALLPAVALAVRRIAREPAGRLLLPAAWSLALPLLAYAPVDLQRRLTEGGWVALLVLAAFGMGDLSERLRRPARIGLAAALLPSSLLVIAAGLLNVNQPGEPIYRTTEQISLFRWLGDHSEPGAVVLAGFQTSNALPAWAPVTVVTGHGPESAGLASIAPQIDRFYSAAGTDVQRSEFAHTHDVEYLYWGPAERTFDGWQPADWDCLTPAFRQGQHELYRVCD